MGAQSEALVPVGTDLAQQEQRRAALERLNMAAETTDDPAQAHQIMVQGRTLAQLLQEAKVPLEQAVSAGKASVVAGRRLGVMLAALSSAPTARSGRGSVASDRTRVREEAGIARNMATNLIRLARVADPDFQRYIQRGDTIPSVTGALRSCHVQVAANPDKRGWLQRRRSRVGVTTPASPSLDEAYSLIVRALGHLSGVTAGGPKRMSAVAATIDHLYAAEDMLKPYRGGYVDGT